VPDANCNVHGTPLNGFGTFTFCSECDAENESIAEAPELLETPIPVGDLAAWAIFSKQVSPGLGNIELHAGMMVRLIKPTVFRRACVMYKVNLRDIPADNVSFITGDNCWIKKSCVVRSESATIIMKPNVSSQTP
jgi:hypothetical protein